MALKIISVVLFTVFFSEALSLVCYNCSTFSSAACTQNATCPSNSQCSSVTIYNAASSNFASSMKQCANSSSCVNSSINLGWARMSSQCCSSDSCNSATASDSANELTCYSCSGTNCSNTLKCKNDENQCITATVSNIVLKGCASQTFCKSPMWSIELLSSIMNSTQMIISQYQVSCCGTNLCNNAQSMTQGHVLLLVPILPLLFYI